MSATLSSAPAVIQTYYQVLTGGSDAYGDGAALRRILIDDFVFEGSLAGRHVGADGFVMGAGGFVGSVQSIGVLAVVTDGTQTAVLYDATLPGGVVRFSEFLTHTDTHVTSLILTYDGQDYLAKGGQ